MYLDEDDVRAEAFAKNIKENRMYHQMQRQQNMQTISETPLEAVTRIKNELLEVVTKLEQANDPNSHSVNGLALHADAVVQILTPVR